MFQILGKKMLGDFMVSNDTEGTTKDMGELSTKMRFIDNFVSFSFWSKI